MREILQVLGPMAQALARHDRRPLPPAVRRAAARNDDALPGTIANDLLQGKFGLAGRDTGRFVINSLLGLGGIADVASEMDLERRFEDFGQTLAYWGVPAGPYLVLPFLGRQLQRFYRYAAHHDYSWILFAVDFTSL